MKQSTKNLFQISLLGGIYGLIAGIVIWFINADAGYAIFIPSAGLAALITTAVLAWWIIIKPNVYTAWRGAIAGALSGEFSHFLCWYLQVVFSNVCYWLKQGCEQPTLDLVSGLGHALILSIASIFLVSWVTILVGATIGAVWAYGHGHRFFIPMPAGSNPTEITNILKEVDAEAEDGSIADGQ
ncbi:hypothetical protein TI04_00995 [Achromatium sp. WMS2]|nr:hypothetical protein TI04_00995 [Achromatium sp. WMS2]